MKFSLILLSLLGFLVACHADAVRLQINGPDGKPVAHAKVRVVEFRMSGPLPARDFESDANGVVSLESQGTIIADINAVKRPDATMSLLEARVQSPGLALAMLQLKAGDNTLALTPGQTLEGVVQDNDEKPVANAHLAVVSLPAPAGDTSFLLQQLYIAGLSDDLAIETTTDAQGHWKFESLPRTGQVGIQVNHDRFRRETFFLDVAKPTPPLFVTPGVVLRGRLLTPEGKGAAGVRIYVGDARKQPVTDAEGRFEATGLGDDDIYLQVVGRDQNLPFLVVHKQVDGLKPGEVRDIGDWQTQKGVHLKGVIVDKATKKPVEGASVSMWTSGANSNSESDKNGAFDMMVSPQGSNYSVYAPGYISYSSTSVPDVKDGVIDVGKIELQAGKAVTGVVVDEAGHPVGNATLFATGRNVNRVYARTNPNDGTFSFEGLEDGAYTITVNGYEATTEVKFNVGTGVLPALRVVVKGDVGQTQKAVHTIEGRVVDGEGTPIGGAKIVMYLDSRGSSYDNVNAVSQLDGTFKALAPTVGATLRVVSISRPGFVRGEEKIEGKDGNWRVDVTLQKRGEALRGRIVDAGGHPVAGAYVGLQNNSDLPIATDDNGAFALPDAPQTGVTLLASNGPSLATFVVPKGKAPVEIALPEAAPVQDKAALADQLLTQGRLGYEWQKQWDVLGQKRIEAALLRHKDSWNWREYLKELAWRDPQVLLAREAELRAQTPADVLPDFEVLVMANRASSADAAQREQARAWLGAQEKETRDISAGTVSRLLGLALVGSRLDQKTGAMWLDYAVQIAGQLDAKGAGEYSWQWAPLAARISPEAPLLLAQDWSPTIQLQFLSTAMRTWVASKNEAAARKGWEQMQELAADAAQHPDPGVKVEGYLQKPDDLLNQARNQYAEILAQTNPKAALALIGAATVEAYRKVEVIEFIAREAVKQKQFDVAREAVRALADTPIGNVEYAAAAAGLAQQFDDTLAAQLWPRAYAKARPRDDESRGGWQPSIASYAAERANKWPGESRILIEREWAKRVAQAAKPKPVADDDYDSNSHEMQSLATAMAHLAPRRAIEMAEQITDKENLRAETRAAIATVLLSPETP